MIRRSPSLPEIHQRIFEAMPAAVVVSRVDDGVILLANAAVEAMLGYSPSELVGRSAGDLDLWADPSQRAQMLALLEADGRVDAFSARSRHRDGRLVDTLSSIQALDIDGRTCLVGITHDITERSQAEDALRHSELRLRQIAESIDEGFVLASVDPFRILYASPTYAELLGTTLDEVYRQPATLIEALHPDDEAQVRASRARMMAGDPSGEVEARLRGRHGSERWIRLRWTKVDSEEGNSGLVAAVAEDVTGRKRAEREVALAKAVAEEASQAKSTFLSRISHELRTPLNVILGFGQLLEIDDLQPEQREALDEIMVAGRHLLHLVDEVLDISRAESGSLDLTDEPIAVAEVVARVVARQAPEAARRGIELRSDASCDQPVRGDARRLGEALNQLVENAIVHNTLTGSVDVRCQPRPGRRVRISIEDTGPGLAPEEIERIYLPFERTQGSGGTGLGLPLARRLVEAMGGEVGARSVPGRGSQFWIDLPVAAAEPGAPPPPPPPPTASTRRVLYVEDNASNAELAARALGSLPDTTLTVAPRGQDGLDLLATETFDLVLLDLHLPDIGGEEILRRIQADDRLAGLPVVVISADASPDVISRVLAGGAAEYLTKPINIAHLLRVVERRSGPSPDPAPPSGSGPAAPSPPPAPSLEDQAGPGDDALLDEEMLESLQVLDDIEAGTVRDLVELFAQAGEARVAEMEARAPAPGAEGLAELAHALRGSGANLGARRLAALCRQLERASRAGDTERAGALIGDVRRAFDESIDQLRRRIAGDPTETG